MSGKFQVNHLFSGAMLNSYMKVPKGKIYLISTNWKVWLIRNYWVAQNPIGPINTFPVEALLGTRDSWAIRTATQKYTKGQRIRKKRMQYPQTIFRYLGLILFVPSVHDN